MSVAYCVVWEPKQPCTSNVLLHKPWASTIYNYRISSALWNPCRCVQAPFLSVNAYCMPCASQHRMHLAPALGACSYMNPGQSVYCRPDTWGTYRRVGELWIWGFRFNPGFAEPDVGPSRHCRRRAFVLLGCPERRVIGHRLRGACVLPAPKKQISSRKHSYANG